MCGRFTIRTAPNVIAMMFDVAGGLDSVADVRLRYNVAPTTPVLGKFQLMAIEGIGTIPFRELVFSATSSMLGSN